MRSSSRAGPGYKRDLRIVRHYIREFKPVLVAVDGGADALLDAGYRPHIIVGDMDSVSDRALASGAELVVHAYEDGQAPGRARLDRLGLAHVAVPMSGISEDLAMLLAHEKGAELIVAVGTHFNLVEFLERNRAGMSSTFLTRLKVGGDPDRCARRLASLPPARRRVAARRVRARRLRRGRRRGGRVARAARLLRRARRPRAVDPRDRLSAAVRGPPGPLRRRRSLTCDKPMFDLRYHVASLAAVFIALAVGIVIGVAIAGGGEPRGDHAGPPAGGLRRPRAAARGRAGARRQRGGREAGDSKAS